MLPNDDSLGLTRFLLEQKAPPNLELPTICYHVGLVPIVNRLSVGEYLPSPPWTTWNLILLRLSHHLFYNIADISVACRKRLELYLQYGADSTVCFVGYQLRGRKRNLKESLRIAKEVGPFYVDLRTMLILWGVEVSDALQVCPNESFRSRCQQLGRWIIDDWIYWGQGLTNGLRQSSLADLQKQEFLVLKVASLQKVRDIQFSDLENNFNVIRRDVETFGPSFWERCLSFKIVL